MTGEYFDAIANFARSLITHIGLVDQSGAELAGAGYRRQPVTWTLSEDGQIGPTSDLLFIVPPHTTVTGWHGFSAGQNGTDYGGEALVPESFTLAGEYLLKASGTGIVHRAAHR